MLQYGFFTAQNTGTPEDPEYDRTYGEAFFSRLVDSVFGVGVNGFEVVQSGGLSVEVSPGTGCVNGYFFYDQTPAQLSISTVTAARTDSIAFRLNYTDRTVSLVVLEGTTMPTRTSTIHDIIIGQLIMPENTAVIDGTMIVDTRDDFALCGRLVTSNPVVLYRNFAGAENDVTLSDNSINYEYLEIFYKDNDAVHGSVRICRPTSGARVDLSTCVPRSTGVINIKSRIAYVNGNKIETKATHDDYYAEVDSVGSEAMSGQSVNHIYITKVLGWR